MYPYFADSQIFLKHGVSVEARVVPETGSIRSAVSIELRPAMHTQRQPLPRSSRHHPLLRRTRSSRWGHRSARTGTENMAKFRNEVSEIRERTVRQAHRNARPPRSSHRSPRTSTDGLQDREFHRQTRAYLKNNVSWTSDDVDSGLGPWLLVVLKSRSSVVGPGLGIDGRSAAPRFPPTDSWWNTHSATWRSDASRLCQDSAPRHCAWRRCCTVSTAAVPSTDSN